MKDDLEVVHKIFHDFTGRPCRTDGGWCDARDPAEAVVAALNKRSAMKCPKHNIEIDEGYV